MWEAVGERQACAGQGDGIEAAVHAATKVYGSPSTSFMQQLDASITFIYMNRELSLHNAQFVCPKFHRYLMNSAQLSLANRKMSLQFLSQSNRQPRLEIGRG